MCATVACQFLLSGAFVMNAVRAVAMTLMCHHDKYLLYCKVTFWCNFNFFYWNNTINV